MATIRIPPGFKEFLWLLKVHEVRYVLAGGYAVNAREPNPRHPGNPPLRIEVLKTISLADLSNLP